MYRCVVTPDELVITAAGIHLSGGFERTVTPAYAFDGV